LVIAGVEASTAGRWFSHADGDAGRAKDKQARDWPDEQFRNLR